MQGNKPGQKILAYSIGFWLLQCACSGKEASQEEDDYQALQPSHSHSHSLNYDQVMHMPGESDPFKNCSTCHGYDLKSGKASNCYTCHKANDHVEQERKVMHQSGSAFTCVTCHGPNNSGGLGPACSECHR
jgi:DnaJ-class molecular chaperone